MTNIMALTKNFPTEMEKEKMEKVRGRGKASIREKAKTAKEVIKVMEKVVKKVKERIKAKVKVKRRETVRVKTILTRVETLTRLPHLLKAVELLHGVRHQEIVTKRANPFR